MRVLTVYDSLFGNTEKIALAISQKISSHHESYVIKVDRISEEDIKNIVFKSAVDIYRYSGHRC